MFWKVLGVLLVALSLLPVRADSLEIRACTDEEAEEIDQQVEIALDKLVYIASPDNFENLGDWIEEAARSGRSLIYVLPLLPDCADTYLKAYPVQLAIDQYAIAIGLAAAASAFKDTPRYDEFMEDLEKHLREGNRLIESAFPEFYAENFDQD